MCHIRMMLVCMSNECLAMTRSKSRPTLPTHLIQAQRMKYFLLLVVLSQSLSPSMPSRALSSLGFPVSHIYSYNSQVPIVSVDVNPRPSWLDSGFSDDDIDKPWEDGSNPFADFGDSVPYPGADPNFNKEKFQGTSSTGPAPQSNASGSSGAPPPAPPSPPPGPRPRPTPVNTAVTPFNLEQVSAEEVVAQLKKCLSFERLIQTVLRRLPNRLSWEDLDRSSHLRMWRQTMLVCSPYCA